MTALAVTGRLSGIPESDRRQLIERSGPGSADVTAITSEIISRVRRDGDEALRELAVELDGVVLDELEVPAAVIAKAIDSTPRSLRSALERAARNIETVHSTARPQRWEVSPEPGVIVGRRPDPLMRVGVYAPGGRAVYPSSVLMGAVPARVAGVREVILASPPGADGLPAQLVLAAAALAGVDRVFAIGGAGAIAALAYGTRSVPRVDRIVGPGNAYVAEAKAQLSRVVGMDSPAGPSELMVIADAEADADAIAAEMIAQAEHEVQAAVIALVVGSSLANSVVAAISVRLADEPRRGIISQSLAERGAVLEVGDLGEAVEFVEQYAPEHLLVATSDPAALLPRLKNVGTVFLGARSSVAYGDYITGANHVLPTGGAARSYSGLSTPDFFRWTSYQSVDRDAAARLAPDTALLANAEGLPGHARAASRGSA